MKFISSWEGFAPPSHTIQGKILQGNDRNEEAIFSISNEQRYGI